jgi:hypothetical protein
MILGRRSFLPALFLLALALPATAQIEVDSNSRLTYRFPNPRKTALELAMAGLPTLEGILVSIDLQRGDSVAQVAGRVRDAAWAQNPGVQGEANGEAIFFGSVQAYLAGDPRFRILVHPSRCRGCSGMLEVVFLRYDDSGYLVGRTRQRKSGP